MLIRLTAASYFAALEADGIDFTNGRRPGVRLRKAKRAASIAAEDLNASNDE